MAEEKAHPFQGYAVSGDKVFIESDVTDGEPVTKLSDIKTGDEILKQLEDEFPDEDHPTKTD
jgi:hypothetical protein